MKEDFCFATVQRQTFAIAGDVLEMRFLSAMESILDFAEKIGFDLDGVLFPQAPDPSAKNNQLLATALSCSEQSSVFLPRAIAEYEQEQLKMKSKLVKAVAKSRSKRKVSELYIAIEYIEYLSCVLPAKLFVLFTENIGSKEDKLGYAKMVIEVVKRIVSSWDIVLEQIAGYRESYMELLLDYYWIMASVEASFAGAGKYVRKGLDE